MSLIMLPSLSSSASVINAQLTTLPLVAYLKPYAEFGVLLYSEYRCYYTPKNRLRDGPGWVGFYATRNPAQP
jgi:hypothetical protein